MTLVEQTYIRKKPANQGLTGSKALTAPIENSAFGSAVSINKGSFPRRSRFEMCFDIQKVIRQEGEAKPTHVMFKANLPWKLFRQDIDYLLGRALIQNKRTGARETFALTMLGSKVLTLASQLGSLLVDEIPSVSRTSGDGMQGRWVGK